ncbi:MAG TPA: hypothetical protein VLY87_05305 [Flavobacterium sp.]|nr:hypothetical protein [Flavobacterium sp.]
MKNILIILISCLLLIGCKTKQVTTDHLKVEQTQDYDYTVLLDYLSKNQSTKELTATEKAEFKEFISNLNITYDGQDVNDKLDVLLKKLADGTTQLTLQGKGTANYNESNKTQFEALQKYFKSYQDSIQKINVKNQEQLKNDLFVRIDEKTKQVDSKTFTWQVWLIIGLAVIVGMCLSWLSKQFKPLLKAV